MGADLIGFLVKGPKDLRSKRDEAVAHLRRFADETASCLTALKGFLDSGEGDFDIPPAVDDAMRMLGIEDVLDLEWVAELDEGAAAAVVDNLLDAWHRKFRDVVVREDPDDEDSAIVFAGCMSWGDEPDGSGYLAIRNALALGLGGVFGIR